MTFCQSLKQFIVNFLNTNECPEIKSCPIVRMLQVQKLLQWEHDNFVGMIFLIQSMRKTPVLRP